MSTAGFRSANLVESVAFTALIGVPSIVLGIFRNRRVPTQVASRVGLDRAAHRLLTALTQKYGPRPFYVNVGRERTLVVHQRDDLRFVLQQASDSLSSDPEVKRKGMCAFQPDALTISRGDLRESRRRFAESVLDTGATLHRLADRMLAIAVDEAATLRAARTPLDWAAFNTSFQRLTRRMIFGEAAADDADLTEQLERLMASANRLPGAPAEGYDRFEAHIAEHLARAEPGSLAALIADTTEPPGGASGQVIHWQFAAGDTLAASTFRTLSILGTHPQHLSRVRAELAAAELDTPAGIAQLTYLAACLQETMRLWPTTQMLGRVARADVQFPDGTTLPMGDPLLIINTFNHRNRERVPYADRFTPEEWVSGQAKGDWQFNFFSHGPQSCPGADLAVYLGQAMLAHLLRDRVPEVAGTKIVPHRRLPHSLDLYGLRVALR